MPSPFGHGYGRGSRHMLRDGQPKQLPQPEALRHLARRMWPFLRPRLPAILVGFACMLGGLALSKAPPLLVRWFVAEALTPYLRAVSDAALRHTALRYVLIGGFAMLGAALLRALLSGIHSRIIRGAGASMVRDLRAYIYRHLQTLSLRY